MEGIVLHHCNYNESNGYYVKNMYWRMNLSTSDACLYISFQVQKRESNHLQQEVFCSHPLSFSFYSLFTKYRYTNDEFLEKTNNNEYFYAKTNSTRQKIWVKQSNPSQPIRILQFLLIDHCDIAKTLHSCMMDVLNPTRTIPTYNSSGILIIKAKSISQNLHFTFI